MDNNENLFYQQEYYFWSAICANTVKISNQTSAYFSELPLPIFNYIYLHQGALISDYEKAEVLFKQQAKPYVLVVHDQILSLFESEIIISTLFCHRLVPLLNVCHNLFSVQLPIFVFEIMV